MPASAARIEANRKNSRLSTGPKTPQGKERSRANALQHGLCSSVVGFQGSPTPQEPPQGPAGPGNFGGWLVSQVSQISLQVEHAQSMQEAARDRIALRADLVWEHDRRLEVTILGSQLAHRPEPTLEQLRLTPQGCDWLKTRWSMLAHAADKGQGWTPEQSSLAFDLLGTPFEFRQGNDPGTTIDQAGRLDGPIADPAALARREIEDLKERSKLVQKIDDADRRDAAAGLTDDAEIRRLLRYEATLHRRLQWTLGLLQQASAPARPAETTEPELPTSAEPLEVARVAGLPTRSASRAEKKLKKAESRRQAKIRSLEKLRA